jgi:hypothetical protein
MGVALFTAALVSAVALPASRAATTPRLVATVGPKETISLVDARGRPVKKLRRGTYRFVVRDRSTRENFHLFGPSIRGFLGVTSFRFRGTVTWKIRLAPGTYQYRSDAHPRKMRGTFRVY